MAITIRQIANKEYPNLGNPIDCLIQSTEVAQPNFKLRAKVLVNGVQRADLRFPALGSQYFKFDIAPIVRDYATYKLTDTLSTSYQGNFRLILSELFTSGGVTVEQSSTTSNLYSTVDACEDWNEWLNTSPNLDAFLIQISKAYIYTGFSHNLISTFVSHTSGSVYDLSVNIESAPLATYTPEESAIGVFTWQFNPQNITQNLISVFVDDETELTSVQIVPLNPCTRFGRYGLTFKNQWGGYEPLVLCRFGDVTTDTAERSYYTTAKGQRSGNTIVYSSIDTGIANASRIMRKRTRKLTTDWMNDEQMQAFMGIMISTDVYLYDEEIGATGELTEALSPVKVVTGSMERKYREKDGLFYAEIEVELDDQLVRYGS